MKLARPDIFHPRLVLAGRSAHAAGDPDDAGLQPALRARGLHARWLSWDDPDTSRADLVILRAAHDYAERRDEFLGWTRTVKNLLNPPAAVAWNLDEHYLRDLEDAGVPTRPVGRARPVDRTALVFVGGERSHAFTESRSVEPDFEFWDLGYAAVAAAAAQVGIGFAELLYARVDVAGTPSDVRLVGLDLVAPSLGWRRLDATTRGLAQRQFALAVASACERLGLGPFSHRGP
jgi:hypothetical protein